MDSVARFIADNEDNLLVQDYKSLKLGVKYYFTEHNKADEIYEGTLQHIFYPKNGVNETRYVFTDVTIYGPGSKTTFICSISTPFIEKIYYL